MISKQKIYTCKICGAQYPKWLGQCAKCGSWNSIEEDIIKKGPKNDLVQSKSVVKNISEIMTTINAGTVIHNPNNLADVLVSLSLGTINLKYPF